MTEPPTLDNDRIVHYHRSGAVTAIAYIMIVITILAFINTVYQYFFLDKMSNLQSMLDKQNIHYGWLDARKMGMIILSFFFLGFAFDMVKIWAAVSLNRRKRWARIFYLIYFLVLGVLALIGIAVISVMIYFGKGLTEQQNTQATSHFWSWSALIIVLLEMLFYFFGLFTLTSQKVKEEFSS